MRSSMFLHFHSVSNLTHYFMYVHVQMNLESRRNTTAASDAGGASVKEDSAAVK